MDMNAKTTPVHHGLATPCTLDHQKRFFLSVPRMNRTPSHPSAAQRRVQQMISMAPKQFEELTVCHLSRRLELNDNKLDELINGKAKSSGRKNSLMRIASPFHVKRAKCESEKDGGRMDVEVCSETVNAVCKLILSLNNTSDLQEEGLFRKSGSIARLRELKEKILKDCSLDLSPYTPHDRANVIKQLLMDIPEPLLLERHFEAFEQATALKDNGLETADQRCLRVIQLLMLRLPRNNSTLTRRLMLLLTSVAEEPANKMDAVSLGTLFAPHLLCSKQVQSNAACFNSASQIATKAVTFMIKNSTKIFQVPAEFNRDVTQFLRSQKRLSDESSGPSTPVCGASDAELSPVSTSLTYSAKSNDLQDTTKAELAKLQAHIQSLPEAAKRKLSKQLNDAAVLSETASTPADLRDTPRRYRDTPRKHVRSKSLSSSIRKRLPQFSSKRKRHPGYDSTFTGSPVLVAVNIDFEDNTSDNSALIVDCCPQSATSAKSTSIPSMPASLPDPQIRRRRRHSAGEEITATLKDIENQNLKSPHSSPVKCVKSCDSPLPVSEKEVAFLPAPEKLKRIHKLLSPLHHCSPRPRSAHYTTSPVRRETSL